MTEVRNGYVWAPTSAISPNHYNPNTMTQKEFAQLCRECEQNQDILRPIVVRKGPEGGRYVIVDGEHN
jgi:ParB-like chromosome segregation protein Spo0J